MKTGKKLLSLLLALLMAVSLFSGTVCIGADAETGKACFALTDGMAPGEEILLVAESGGSYYAFAYDGGFQALEITVDGGD